MTTPVTLDLSKDEAEMGTYLIEVLKQTLTHEGVPYLPPKAELPDLLRFTFHKFCSDFWRNLLKERERIARQEAYPSG